MKTLLLSLFAALCLAAPASAQVSSPSTIWHYAWPAATATGQVGQYLVMPTNVQSGGPSSSYTVDVYVTGTLPSVCTFEVQSSPDGVVWNTGTASLSGDQSCSSATTLTYSFAFKPTAYLRVNIGTLTGADGTTKAYFFYTRGRNAQ